MTKITKLNTPELNELLAMLDNILYSEQYKITCRDTGSVTTFHVLKKQSGPAPDFKDEPLLTISNNHITNVRPYDLEIKGAPRVELTQDVLKLLFEKIRNAYDYHQAKQSPEIANISKVTQMIAKKIGYELPSKTHHR